MIRTPIRAPRANAFAERWVRKVRAECLDWTLVRERAHPDRVVRVYAEHYNAEAASRAGSSDAFRLGSRTRPTPASLGSVDATAWVD